MSKFIYIQLETIRRQKYTENNLLALVCLTYTAAWILKAILLLITFTSNQISSELIYVSLT